jgi:VanZ family protein
VPSSKVASSLEKFLSEIALSRKVLVPMALTTDAIYHLSVLFILSIIVLPLKRSSLVALLLAIPALTEIVQFFMPGRIPDFMDAFHGYLGIILAYCLVQMWSEIAPVVKKLWLHSKESETL